MNEYERATAQLWGELSHWLGFRQGIESQLMNTDPDKWAEHSDKTRRWFDQLSGVGFGNGYDLARVALPILAEGRGINCRELLRRFRRDQDENTIAGLVLYLLFYGPQYKPTNRAEWFAERYAAIGRRHTYDRNGAAYKLASRRGWVLRHGAAYGCTCL